jgi:membrane-bound lytic murein transglycosylase B
MFRIILLSIILIFSLNANSKVTGLYAKNKEVKRFINYMIRKHNFKRSYLIEVFSKARKPVPFKLKKRKRRVAHGMIKGKNRWLRYSGYTRHERAFLAKDRVLQGVKFVKRYKTLFTRIENRLKVDKYIVAAIIGIESYYGEMKGRWEAFNILAYYSFVKKQRARFFKYELENLLLLSYRQKLNALYLKGSKYGALGIGQLMPHSYIKYGVSFDGNKKIEPFSNPDSIATVANFLHKKGWSYQKPVAIRARFDGKWIPQIKNNRVYSIAYLRKKGLKIAKTKARFLKVVKLKRAEFEELWLAFKNFKILKRYNNSNYYAMAVYQLAQEIKKRDKK